MPNDLHLAQDYLPPRRRAEALGGRATVDPRPLSPACTILEDLARDRCTGAAVLVPDLTPWLD